jgi:hypothetical protein
VIQRAGILDTKGSGHGVTLSRANVAMQDLTPKF